MTNPVVRTCFVIGMLACGATAPSAAPTTSPCRRGTTVSRGVRSAPGMAPPTRLILENASEETFCRVDLVSGAAVQSLYEGTGPGFDPGSILPVDATAGAYTVRWTPCGESPPREVPVEVHAGEETTIILREGARREPDRSDTPTRDHQ